MKIVKNYFLKEKKDEKYIFHLKENFLFLILFLWNYYLNQHQNIKKIYPNLNIVGYQEGFFETASEDEVIKQINELQPNVLFVAMGAPIQEKWIAKHQKELKVDVAAGQGGTFDYEAGKIKRAPVIFQKLGIEWLWRLILQPSRIFRMVVLPIYLLKKI